MKTAVKLLTILALFFTAIQLYVPEMPISQESQMIVSAIVMFLVTGTTIWKQKLSECINNSALIPTVILGIVATLGGLNELVKVFPINEVTGQWIRLSITGITALLNASSETLFPSSKSIIDNKTKPDET